MLLLMAVCPRLGNTCTLHARQVAERVRALFASLEAAHRGQDILLVSHGDTLSILWAVVKGLPLQEHRKHGLATGQLRELHGV
jgi:broad specificity phosphatase PhoE